MKKLALILFILVGSSFIALVEDPAMAALLLDTTHVILGGVVKTVSWADPIKGTKSEITVIDATGKKINIYVLPTTTLWDADSKAIMPDKIVAKSHVNVIYLTTPEGINVGKSIKILK
jgi:hypothetical protein